jgi:hypothetical protein
MHEKFMAGNAVKMITAYKAGRDSNMYAEECANARRKRE